MAYDRVFKKLGGGMGLVYEVENGKLRHIAGLSFLEKETTPVEQALRRFQR